MTLLPVGPFYPKEGGKKGYVRESLQQTLVPRLRQEPLWVDPGVGLLGLEGGRADRSEAFKVQVRHSS